MKNNKLFLKKFLLCAYNQNPGSYNAALMELSKNLQFGKFHPRMKDLTKEFITVTIRNFVDQIKDIINLSGPSTKNLTNQENLELIYNFMLDKLISEKDDIYRKNLYNFEKFFNKHIRSPGRYEKSKALEIKNNQYLFPNFIRYPKWINDLSTSIEELQHQELLCGEAKESIKEIQYGLRQYAFELIEKIISTNKEEDFKNKKTLIEMLQSLIRITCNVNYDDHDLSRYTLPDFSFEFNVRGMNYNPEEQEAILSLNDWTQTLKQIKDESNNLKEYIEKNLLANANNHLKQRLNIIIKYIIKTIKLVKAFSFIDPNASRTAISVESASKYSSCFLEEIEENDLNGQKIIKVVTLDKENNQNFAINQKIINKLGFYANLLLPKENQWTDKDNLECVAEGLHIINSENERSLLLNFFEILANGKIKYPEVTFEDLLDLNNLFKYFMLEDPLLQQSMFNQYMLSYINSRDMEDILKDLELEYNSVAQNISYIKYESQNYTPTYQHKLQRDMIANNFIATLPTILDEFIKLDNKRSVGVNTI